MKLFLPCFLILALIGCNSKSREGATYSKKVIEFITDIESGADRSSFLLMDEPSSLESMQCLQLALKDTTFFTPSELAYINLNKQPSLKKWPKNIFAESRLISSDSIREIFKNQTKGWDDYYKKVDKAFSTYSMPLFFRNDTYCLFYSSHHCGSLCGGGELALYRKTKDGWKKEKSYCEWIS